MSKTIGWLSSSLERIDPLRQAAQQAYVRLRKRGVAMRMRGELVPGGPALTLLYVGRPDFAHAVQTLFFCGGWETDQLGPVRRRSQLCGAGSLRCSEDDVVVVDCWPRWQRDSQRCLGLAPYLNAELCPGPDADSYIDAQVGKDHRRALKRAAKLGLRCRRGSVEGELESFFHDVLVPDARARHGVQVCLPDPSEVRALRSRLDLFWVEHDGATVAGGLLLASRARSRLELWRVGLRDHVYRDPKLVRAVNATLDAHGLRRASEEGYRTYSLGPTSPVLSNGLLGYKLRWGCKLVAPYNSSLYALWLTSPRWRGVLRQRPLVLADAAGLYGLMGCDQDEPAFVDEVRQLCRSRRFEGLREIRVAVPEGSELAGAVAALPQEDLGVPVRLIGSLGAG